MGTVERPIFGGKRPVLTGFIPADLGMDALERRRAAEIERERQIGLIGFAKSGQPNPSEKPPDDCA